MTRLFLVAALPLVVSGCVTTPPEVTTYSSNPDTIVDVAPIAYQNPVGAYSHRMPVDPKPWRGLNDAQAPDGGA
jgi:starvation-inducible outer membrane lipoprotein